MCLPCPDKGHCDGDGKLACAAGYQQQGQICVEKEAVKQKADIVLKDVQHALQVKNGRF